MLLTTGGKAMMGVPFTFYILHSFNGSLVYIISRLKTFNQSEMQQIVPDAVVS